jgi:hypothetical protein
MNSKLFSLSIAISAIVCCAHFSQNSSVDGQEKPKVNFYGELYDQTGRHYNVENINISGMYRQIPFYKKPRKISMNPETNTTRIDLKETMEIRVPTRDEAAIVSTFKNREYVTVEIVLNDPQQTRNDYIIEKSRKLYCDEVSDAGPIEKELSFEAVNKIIIKGYKPREEACPNNKKKNNESHE